MNLKKILVIIFSVILYFCLQFAIEFYKASNKEVQTISTETKVAKTGQLNVWCVTLQLAWNELSEKFIKGPVNFVGGNPPLADELNKKLFTSDILSEKSYYTTWGKISSDLKKQIEENIKKKFNETSDILNFIDWNAKDSYLFYSMLVKNFTFKNPFDILPAHKFNNSGENVKYFGINEQSEPALKDNVTVLFYNSPDDYAVKLNTNENEDVILYRHDNNKKYAYSLDIFNYVIKKSSLETFKSKDSLLIPEIVVDKIISYDELCNKQIEGTNYEISQALQTIKFKLDNKGGSLKSEAVIGLMKTSLDIEEEQGRNFNFDKPFLLFLVESGKDKPYFSMWVKDTEFLVKE